MHESNLIISGLFVHCTLMLLFRTGIQAQVDHWSSRGLTEPSQNLILVVRLIASQPLTKYKQQVLLIWGTRHVTNGHFFKLMISETGCAYINTSHMLCPRFHFLMTAVWSIHEAASLVKCINSYIIFALFYCQTMSSGWVIRKFDSINFRCEWIYIIFSSFLFMSQPREK